MQQIYSGTPMLKCYFNKVAYWNHISPWCSPVNLLHIFRTPFLKNTSGWLLLYILAQQILNSLCRDHACEYFDSLIEAIKIKSDVEAANQKAGVIENNRCLMDKRCFWNVDIFLCRDRSIISGSVHPCRQLIRFPSFLSIH